MKKKYKEIYNRVEKDRLDSMFYRMSDDEPLRKVSYKGRTWGIWPYGEVKLTYNESRYYCLSEISEIKTDNDLTKAHDNDELHIHYNNWYEIRPTEDKYFHFVESCIYDEVFGDPYELDKETLDWFIELEKEHIKDYRKNLNMFDKIKDIWYYNIIPNKKEVM